MSIVANVVTSNVSWVAFDGRAIRDGKIVSENQVKAEMINPYVCVGYTGVLEIGKLVVLNLREHIVGISKMKSDTVYTTIRKILPMLKIPEDLYANFIVTGTNSNGSMATYVFGTKEKESVSVLIPHGKEIRFCHIGETTNVDLGGLIQQEVMRSSTPENPYLTAMKRFINEVAKMEISVNSNCRFIEVLKK